MKRIRWKQVWKDFQKWFDDNSGPTRNWERQAKKIQSLVNAELKRKGQK